MIAHNVAIDAPTLGLIYAGKRDGAVEAQIRMWFDNAEPSQTQELGSMMLAAFRATIRMSA